MTHAIETFALTKCFPAAQGWRSLFSRQVAARPAVDQVSIQVKEGELFGLVGPNGAGKTTLIKMLATLIIPTNGSARVNGYNLDQMTEIKASIGLVTSDERSFYWRLSGRQNLEFFATLHHLPAKSIRPRVDEVLELVGMAEVAEKRFQTYSTGMRQRLSIARALLSRPRLLFLDEPTKGLDPLAIQGLHQLIRQQLTSQQGITIFLTSHWLEEIEQLCDRVAIMNQGRILTCGTMTELRGKLGLGEHYRLAINDPADNLVALLREQADHFQVTSGQEGEILIEFDAGSGAERLTQLIDLVRNRGGQLRTLTSQPVSLEDIFTRIIADGDMLEAANPTALRSSVNPDHTSGNALHSGQDRVPPAIPAGTKLRPQTLSIFDTLRIVGAFIKRDFLEEASYRLSFFLQFFSVFFSTALFYFLAKMLGDAAAPYLSAYGGDYFAFVLIGIAFAGYFSVGLSSFSTSLRQAQTTGTLEAMLTTPTNLSTIILSSSLWSYFMTTLRVAIYLAFGALVLGVDLGSGNYPLATLVLALTIVSFSSLGIIAASFIMVIKRGDPIAWLFNATSSLLGGVYYPIAVLPGWLQAIAYLLPITYALRAMRQALLQGASLGSTLPDLLILGVFSLVLLPASLFAFRFAVQRARLDGSLTHY